MKEKTNWQLFVEGFKSLTTLNKHKTWKYIKKLKKCQNITSIESYKYLSGFDSEIKSFVIKIDDEEGLNLYHSIAAFMNRRADKTTDEIFEEYMSIYKERRVYLKGNETIIKDLVEGIYNKLKKRGSI